MMFENEPFYLAIIHLNQKMSKKGMVFALVLKVLRYKIKFKSVYLQTQNSF